MKYYKIYNEHFQKGDIVYHPNAIEIFIEPHKPIIIQSSVVSIEAQEQNHTDEYSPNCTFVRKADKP